MIDIKTRRSLKSIHLIIDRPSVIMKLFALIFLASLIASQGAPIISSDSTNIDELFKMAWEYQNKLNPRQEDIDKEVTEFRVLVSKMLNATPRLALEEVESNSKKVLELEEPTRTAVFALSPSSCASNLKNLLSEITEFTGYESSNCVKFYDNSVEREIQNAQNFISNYDGIFTEFQQLVVQSFIGKNQFIQQSEIIETIENEYKRRVENWEEIQPKVETFIDTLTDTISNIHTEMESCMEDIQDNVSVAYKFISSRVTTCIEFENTPNRFKSLLSPLSLKDILPRKQSKNL